MALRRTRFASGQWSSVLCAAVVLVTAGTGIADEPPELRSVLNAREEAGKSFEADVQVVSKPGPDRNAYAEARLRFADWIDKNRPELKTNSLREDVSRMKADGPVLSRKYRYSVSRTGQIRVEHMPSDNREADEQLQARRTHVYNGSQWRLYSEGNDSRTGDSVSGLIIRQQEHKYGWFEIARGVATELHPLMTTELVRFDLPRRSTDVQIVGWSDLLRNVPNEQSRIALETPPNGKDPKPSLSFETPPIGGRMAGAYRLQVWFEPSHGYIPVSLVGSLLQPSGDEGRFQFQPHFAVHWSEPENLADGGTFYRKCLFRFFDQVPLPIDSRPDTEWPQADFDMEHHEFVFENVKVNTPLDVAKFDIAPAPGTHVTDEQKGFTFIVGKAGEELEKAAIAERGKRQAAQEPAAGIGRWRWWFIIANVTIILGLIAYRLLLRKLPGNGA
ncbi:MAG: hypothetical protein AB7O26_02435 [Planctomycetaceae bacterium]